jgi:hypothetical protein
MFIDATGRTVIPAQFFTAESFSEGLASVRLFDGNSAFIDKQGKVKMTLKMMQGDLPLSDFKNGFAMLDLGMAQELIDAGGKVIWSTPGGRKVTPVTAPPGPTALGPRSVLGALAS